MREAGRNNSKAMQQLLWASIPVNNTFLPSSFFALINDIMMVFALNSVQLPQIKRRLKRFAIEDFQREREQETKKSLLA